LGARLAAALASSNPIRDANSITDSYWHSHGIANSDGYPDSHTYSYANRYSHSFTSTDGNPNLNPDPGGAGC
jgi:hypothetical protein